MATLLPNAVQQFLDANGTPLAGGSVYFYIPNTTTPKDTWSDPGATILNTNPILLDAAGENPAGGIYGSGAYRQVVYDADGGLIWDQLTSDTTSGGIAWGGTSSGSANAQTVATSSFSDQDGQQIAFIAGFSNTSQLTMEVGSGSPIAVLSDTGAGPVACSGGEVVAGNVYTITYDEGRGALHVTPTQAYPLTIAGGGTGATTAAQARINLGTAILGPSNLGLLAVAAAGALTISLKGQNGSDPSATNPVVVPFRDPTAATGTPVYLTITTALSLVISPGSTLGFSSNVAGRLWAVLFDDAGTQRLGVFNARSGGSVEAIRNYMLATSTAEGGAGGADSAQVFYTSVGVTTKPIAVLGYFEWPTGIATPGTWTSPSITQLYAADGALPGDIIKTLVTPFSGVDTTSTSIPFDDSIPQIGEGKEFATRTITPTAAANVINTQALLQGSMGSADHLVAAIFVDAGANAIVAAVEYQGSIGGMLQIPINWSQVAGSTVQQTFRLRAGPAGGSATTINGQATARKLGGVINSMLQCSEIMA